MAESKQRYLYLWKHKIVLPDDTIVNRTCFGITSNLDNRRNNYEGHVGHDVEFLDVWVGPDRPIRDLEEHIKSTFCDYMLVGHRNFRYEWITESVEYEQILNWIIWETDSHPSITKLDNFNQPKA